MVEPTEEKINNDNDKKVIRYFEPTKTHYEYMKIWLSLSDEEKKLLLWCWSSANIKKVDQSNFVIASNLNSCGFIALIKNQVFSTFEGECLRVLYKIAEIREARKNEVVLEKENKSSE